MYQRILSEKKQILGFKTGKRRMRCLYEVALGSEVAFIHDPGCLGLEMGFPVRLLPLRR